ncbi:MAG: hypothetical protein OP8BY_1602 [Candidatus Saccharicenans subterraneus]|uniref:Uncharacterized protein n=1 Tax=Candidatus Saccharicenans subterraneus TaxID=2508984 RepID=A0A3E2BNY4_9BACT|nr:MAG: hypothetical protein OP8BY_1602 [Candidatus Saccharicenans subterraneum]
MPAPGIFPPVTLPDCQPILLAPLPGSYIALNKSKNQQESLLKVIRGRGLKSEHRPVSYLG